MADRRGVDQVLDSTLFNRLIISADRCEHSEKASDLQTPVEEKKKTHFNGRTFRTLFRACVKSRDVNRCSILHAEIARFRLLHTNPSIGTFLVDMYAKFGLPTKAEAVLEEIPNADTATWNALISGYIKHDQGHEALKCFIRMQIKGVPADAITYICVVKACGITCSVEKGKSIHDEVKNKGLIKSHVKLGNALVDMYVKFGMLEEAQEVFNQISIRDVVSWNTLIAGYTKQGESEKAIECFEQLQLEDLHPDSISFVCTLKACGSIGAIQKGIEIHNFILKRGLLQTDLAIGNALIDMYSKLGMLDNAQEVFEKMPSRDLISWNTMISGYVKHNYGQRALESYESMLHEGIFPDAITFVSILKASQNLRSIDNAFQVHREILQKGLELDILLSSTLLDTYAKCGWLADAKAVFLRLPFRDVVAWTSLIAGYAEHGYFIDALECFRQMLIEGITPDVVTFVCSLKACASLKALDQAKEIHSMIKARRLVTNPEVGNALVDMLAKCGLIVEAQKVFNQLTYLDSISWTSLIGAYAEAGQGEEALSCLDRMKAAGFTPNAVTYVFGLKACSTIGAVGKGQELHGDICGNKLLKTDLVVGNALVDMYFKCGLPGKGQDVFEKLVNRDVVSYNALITGYAQQGDVDNVEICFERMMEEGISPGLVTFVGILNVCSHVGLIYKGQKHFEAMIENFQVTPTLEHYTCMIDLFCHAGQLSKAIGMLLRMPIDTDVITMRSLLVACQNWANKEVNTHIFCQLLQLKELDSSSYISMLNTLAQSNRFGDN